MSEFLPSTLGKLTVRGFKWPHHLQALEAACLRLVSDPTYNRLIVEFPVRHGKTWYCSWLFAAWYLLRFPQRQIILSMYDKASANEWSIKTQNTIRDYGRRLTGVRLGKVQRQDHFTLAAPYMGQLRTASPGGGIAGKGADLIIGDDLIKDMREVANPLRRNALTTWCNSELLTRLEPGGKVLIVMSRRHPDDQSGRWLAQNPDLPEHEQWHRITMPAIAEDGSALWPERFSVQRLLDIKRRYELDGQSYLWDCLYQQNPRGDSTMSEWPATYWTDVGSSWDIEYDQLPTDLPVKWRLLSLDPSKGKDARRGDYSSFSDALIDTRAGMWVEPFLRVMPTEQVEDHFVAMCQRTRYHAVSVECNNFQETIADNIVRKCQEKGIHCPMYRMYSTENKIVRIRLGLGPLLAQKRIRLYSRSPSVKIALSQLREFPTAAHDDFPDSLNQCCDLINHLLTGKK